MKILTAFLLTAVAVFAQGQSRGAPPKGAQAAKQTQTRKAAPETEDQELGRAISEAGNSPVEFVRVLEKHLQKYPDSPHKAELERALVKAAIENKDDKRIVLYGERVLARDSDDIQILDRVTRALVSTEDKDAAARALKYAKRYEELIGVLRKEPPQGHMSAGQWRDELDRSTGRVLALQARATGNLGRMEEAAELARKSYEAYPTAEGAREIGRWLSRTGKDAEAVEHIADAFTIPDSRNTDAERAKDRARMGELYAKVNGSEKGLGDLILQSYDRTTALVAARRLRLRDSDPNAQLTDPMQFTLSGLNGNKLQLAGLKGKTVVFDFWATWCGPCRAQHPLYEEVKKRFKGTDGVVFLSVNTDEDRDGVEPFLKEQKWEDKVWFEDGLSRALQISSIPTTIVVNGRGEVVSRLNGYVPDRFVDMLTERIRDAMKD
jgi:thiol-disulfide isomerase/thioredoxin